MINCNGQILPEIEAQVSVKHRGFRYGDGVFETILFDADALHFWESHYFRLMAAMRILRMEIPMSFTPEYLEEEIRKTLQANGLLDRVARVRLQVNRKGGGLYRPETNEVEFVIEVNPIERDSYLEEEGLLVDIFKDHLKPIQLLSSIKTCNASLYITAAIWAQENGLDDALLLNEKKQVIESVNSNLFVLSHEGNQLFTSAESSGCLKGIMRKQIIRFAKELDLEVVEKEISPFDLLRVKEIWLTNSIRGVQWVRQYKKTTYAGEKAQQMNDYIKSQFH